jgi:hypothetical protein
MFLGGTCLILENMKFAKQLKGKTWMLLQASLEKIDKKFS